MSSKAIDLLFTVLSMTVHAGSRGEHALRAHGRSSVGVSLIGRAGSEVRVRNGTLENFRTHGCGDFERKLPMKRGVMCRTSYGQIDFRAGDQVPGTSIRSMGRISNCPA